MRIAQIEVEEIVEVELRILPEIDLVGSSMSVTEGRTRRPVGFSYFALCLPSSSTILTLLRRFRMLFRAFSTSTSM